MSILQPATDWPGPPALVLHPMPVHTGGADQEGRLVVADGRLVAVLVRLSDQAHDGMVGDWFLEAGFGPCATAIPPVFGTIEEAEAWIARRLAAGHSPEA